MQCPACNNAKLVPASLEAGLPCYRCTQCEGALVSLPAYLSWRESRADELNADEFEVDTSDSKSALLCSKCSRIMVKFKILHDEHHRLDYCFGCEEVWLDGGEWEWLKAQALAAQVTAITTDVWQRRLRELRQGETQAQRFKSALGEENYRRAAEFLEWLDQQPKKDEILLFLRNSVS